MLLRFNADMPRSSGSTWRLLGAVALLVAAGIPASVNAYTDPNNCEFVSALLV